MNDALRPVAIGVLCILALALAAATLTSPVEVGDPGFGGGGGDLEGPPEEPGGDPLPQPEGNGTGPGTGADLGLCVEPLAQPPVFFGLFVALLGVGAVLTIRDGLPAGTLVVAVGFWPLLFGTLLLTAGCDLASPLEQAAAAGGEVDPPLPEDAGGGGDGSGGQPVAAPSIALAAFLILAIVGVLTAMFATGDEDDEDPPEDPTPDPERRAEIGAVAGEAADRIEDEGDDLENEVYRAWAEMTDALDVDDPETSTTAEFADAAIEAGLRREDVRELTRLFEEVRYGTAEATPEREQRAVSALRNIERQYADDGTIDPDRGDADFVDENEDDPTEDAGRDGDATVTDEQDDVTTDDPDDGTTPTDDRDDGGGDDA